MTQEEHDQYVNHTVLETDFTVIGVIVLGMIVPLPIYCLCACAATLLFLFWFQRWEYRAVRRRVYAQALREYIEAGGTVMLLTTKRKRRRTIAVPIPPPREWS